jgi:acyl-CoA thioesterase FadM
VPVGGSDVLEVQTRVLDFRRARSLRGYTVRREATVVAEATTDWVYCDALTGRPARIPDELQQALAGAAVPLPRAAALIVAPPAEAATAAVRVEPSHLDHVVHVNNAVYASFLEDAAQALFAGHGWPLPRMLGAGGALRAGALDIEYVNDAQLHDDLVVRSWLPQRGSLGMRDGHPHTAEVLQQIARADGTEIVRAHSQWVWRWKPAVVGGVPTL